MPFASVNGINLHYQHHQPATVPSEPAPPVLLLSGMASDSASWQPVVATLRKQYELIIPDNRCTGRTEPDVTSTSRATMLTDIQALLRVLEVDRFSVVGHSMGGMLGWAIASAQPERVHRLVSAAALPSVLPARISLFESLAAMRTEPTEAQWFELFYHFLFSSSFFEHKEGVSMAVEASMAYPFKQNQAAFSQQVKGLKSFLSAPDVAKICCPVTLITGSEDILTTPQMITRFATNHPNVKTHIIEGAAHALHWEQTGAFTNVVLDALA